MHGRSLAAWVRRFIFTVTALAAVGVGVAGATDDPGAKQLTGGTQREWILTRVDMVMGSSTDCVRGERYFFRSTGVVHIERCASRKLQARDERWTLKTRSGILRLTVGARTYEALFIPRGDKVVLRLRTRAMTQAVPTEDKYLTYERD